MNLENPIRMVRELKGAPLSILFALTIVQQRVSQAWLERTTGYTDKTISQALGYLEEIGLADHTSAGWQLTGQAKQLPLPLELEENVAEEEIVADNSDDSCQTRRISDPPIIIITDNNQEEDLSNNNNNNNATGGRKNSDSGLRNALTKAGIWGKKRDSLAKIASLTVESVEAWEAQLKSEKGEQYTPGLLIRALESGEGTPVVPRKKDEKKDYVQGLIDAGLYCESCRQPVQDCECEVEEDG